MADDWTLPAVSIFNAESAVYGLSPESRNPRRRTIIRVRTSADTGTAVRWLGKRYRTDYWRPGTVWLVKGWPNPYAKPPPKSWSDRKRSIWTVSTHYDIFHVFSPVIMFRVDLGRRDVCMCAYLCVCARVCVCVYVRVCVLKANLKTVPRWM